MESSGSGVLVRFEGPGQGLSIPKSSKSEFEIKIFQNHEFDGMGLLSYLVDLL